MRKRRFPIRPYCCAHFLRVKVRLQDKFCSFLVGFKGCSHGFSSGLKLGNRKLLFIESANSKLCKTALLPLSLYSSLSGSKTTFCAIEAFIVSSTFELFGSLEYT